MHALCDASRGADREIVRGLNRVAVANNWSVNISQGIIGEYNNADSPPDAVVTTYSTPPPPKDMRNMPCVGANADLTAMGYPSVVLDDHAIGRLAAEHFAGKGVRHFWAFCLWGTDFGARRRAGFREAVVEMKLNYVDACDGLLPWPPPLPLRKADLVKAAALALPRPIGVLIGCDSWAWAFNLAAANAGLKVGEDLLPIGVDNDDLHCELMHPTLSSVIVPWGELGRQAGLLLERVIQGEREATIIRVVPQEIAQRQSTDVYAIHDATVVAAVAFIRSRAERPISVDDILLAVPVRRRTLEAKFRETLGRTVLEEITRTRMGAARRLLLQSDLSVGQIAERLQFSSGSYFVQMFRRHIGVTPHQYRRNAIPRGNMANAE